MKNISRSSHSKFKYFKFCETFLQRSHSDFCPKSRKPYFLQNGRLTALSGLGEDRRRYCSQNKNYRASYQFSLATVFCWNSKKVDINFRQKTFSLKKNSISDRRKVCGEISLYDETAGYQAATASEMSLQCSVSYVFYRN